MFSILDVELNDLNNFEEQPNADPDNSQELPELDHEIEDPIRSQVELIKQQIEVLNSLIDPNWENLKFGITIIQRELSTISGGNFQAVQPLKETISGGLKESQPFKRSGKHINFKLKNHEIRNSDEMLKKIEAETEKREAEKAQQREETKQKKAVEKEVKEREKIVKDDAKNESLRIKNLDKEQRSVLLKIKKEQVIAKKSKKCSLDENTDIIEPQKRMRAALGDISNKKSNIIAEESSSHHLWTTLEIRLLAGLSQTFIPSHYLKQ